jgi:predicted extracellular nuclease
MRRIIVAHCTTFTVNASGEKLTTIVTILNLKSCSELQDQYRSGDGQGCYNNSRRLQAEALLAFIANIKSSSGSDIISVGDYNAYEQEDPMDILIAEV